MSLTDLVRRLFRRAAQPRNTAFRTHPNRARLSVTALEDRVNPVGSVSVASLGDITENGSAGAFRFVGTGFDTPTEVYFSFSISSTASQLGDFTAGGLWITVSNGNNDLSITPNNDSNVEGTESIIIVISSSFSYNGGGGTATMNIFDDDTVQVSVAQQGSDPTEGGNGTFRITRSGSTSGNLTVNYTSGGTATSGTDYTSIGTSATITSGNSYVDVSVPALADNVVDPDETVTITITDGGSTYTALPTAIADVTIVDDPPTISVSVQNTTEGDTPGYVRFTRSGGNTAASLGLSFTIGGTATNGTDYTTISTSATIGAGNSYVDVEIEALADNVVEASNETVTLTITPTSTYVLNGGAGSAMGSLTIIDDAPTVTVVRIADAVEGTSVDTFRISRSGGDITGSLAVDYSVSGTATSKTDYTALAGTATIDEDEPYVDVAVAAIDDSTADAGETVQLILQADAGYVLAAAYDASTTILDSSTGTITGRAFEDSDEDGIQDYDEGGLSDVTVELYDDTTIVATTLTDGTGRYQFLDVAPGNDYKILFTPLEEDDATFSEQYQTEDTLDSDVNPGTGYTDTFEVSAGDIKPSIDVGCILAAAASPGIRIQFAQTSYYYVKLVLTTVGPNPQTTTVGPVMLNAFSASDSRVILSNAIFFAGWITENVGENRLVIRGKGPTPLNYVAIASCTWTVYELVNDNSIRPVFTGLGGATETGAHVSTAPPANSDTTNAVWISFGPPPIGGTLTVTLETVGNVVVTTSAITLTGSTRTGARDTFLSDLQTEAGVGWEIVASGDGSVKVTGKTVGGVLDPIKKVTLVRSAAANSVRLSWMGTATGTTN